MSSNKDVGISEAFYRFAQLVMISLFLAVSILQLFSFPGQFRYEASNSGGSQVTRWALTFAVGLWLFLAQVAIVALSKILTLIRRDALLTPAGSQWFNLLIRTFTISALYGTVITFVAALTTDDPGPVVIVASLTTFIVAIYVVGFFIRHQIFHLTKSDSRGRF